MKNEKRQLKSKNLVYEAVRRIPLGEVVTYKQIAQKIGYPKAWRAVGNILNKNMDPKIPCHRVIRSDGKIGEYNRGIKKKIALLKKEGIIINSHGRIHTPGFKTPF